MFKKTLFFSLLILILAVALSACERSASTGPVDLTEPATASSQEPVATSSDPMEMLRSFATQTAQAMAAGSQGGPTSTVTAIPLPGTTQVATLSLPTSEPTDVVIINTPVPPTTTKPENYTLQEGEYPFCIARRYNVDPSELLALNGMNVNSFYYAGQILKIPQTDNTFPGERTLLTRPSNYTVRAGDTIYKIACAYGDIDPITIASANNLVAPYTLTVGSTLSIP